MISNARESLLYKFQHRKLSKAVSMSLLAGLSSTALADGNIQGRVVSDNSDIGLRGAFVEIKELDLVSKTERGGVFHFSSVPAGEYTLTVDYLGGEKKQSTVSVVDDQTVQAQLSISPSVNGVENVLVLGDSASFNKALNRQRSADAIKSIVSADAIGQYPDANTSEALQRLPGISIEQDQGEGRWVRVRGLGPEFNAVTINGSKVPSPNSGNRAVALDVIPSDLLESLVVTKALTPDMDADSLGGTIDVQSLSAFDRDKAFYKLSAETSYDEHTSNSSPKFALSGSKKFSLGGEKENFGIAGAISWFERDFGSDNVETGGSWSDGELEEVEQRDYTITRERTGAALNFDFKPSKTTDLYLRTLYSEYTDTEVRQANIFKFANGLAPGATSVVTADNLVEEEIDVMERELKDRAETAEISSLVLGGESRINQWTVEYALGHSKASEDTPYHISGAVFERELENGGFSYSNTEIIDLNGPEGYLDNSEFEEIGVELSQQLTEDEETNFRIDVQRSIALGDNSGSVKFGAKISRREKTSDEEVWSYENEGVTLADVAGANIDYQFGNMGSEMLSSSVMQLVQSGEPEKEDIDSIVNDFEIDEDISAAYLMGTFETPKLHLLFGVRYEQTDMTALGNRVVVLEDDATQEETETFSTRNVDNDYSNVLPALHARYEITEKTQIRGAWTNSVVRPIFDQLHPGFNRDNDEAEFGNPSLDPLTSSNLDVGVEHFLGFASVISAFVFYKSIDDFIYQIDLGEEAGIEGVEQAVTYRNGDSANISGLELAANKQFGELPEPWNGLFIGVNATWTSSDAEISYFSDGQIMTRDLTLPSQSDFTSNFTVGWENSTFSIRLASSYKSEYLLEVNNPEESAEDVYVDSHTSIDLLARWYVTDKVQVFLQGVNLGDEPYYTYIGNSQYNNQYEEYGPTYRLGVSLTNF